MDKRDNLMTNISDLVYDWHNECVAVVCKQLCKYAWMFNEENDEVTLHQYCEKCPLKDF